MSAELKPCPFCGADAEVIFNQGNPRPQGEAMNELDALRKILLEGAKQYRTFVLQKGSYIGYQKALDEYDAESVVDLDDAIDALKPTAAGGGEAHKAKCAEVAHDMARLLQPHPQGRQGEGDESELRGALKAAIQMLQGTKPVDLMGLGNVLALPPQPTGYAQAWREGARAGVMAGMDYSMQLHQEMFGTGAHNPDAVDGIVSKLTPPSQRSNQ